MVTIPLQYFVSLHKVLHSATKRLSHQKHQWLRKMVHSMYLASWKQKINLEQRATFNTTGSKPKLLVIPTYYMNPQLNNPGNYSNKWQAADSNNLLTKPRIPINYLSMIFIGIIIKSSVPIP